MPKYVYSFREGNKDMKDLLGGKGANLSEMTSIGLSVPRGFTVTTEACNKYYRENETISGEVEEEIFKHISLLEEETGKKFGSLENPLLVSVRSGARASMPGMMDTILNLGLNDDVTKAIAVSNKRFAYDSYRRFIMMFADVVKGYPKSQFERLLDKIKIEKNAKSDLDLNSEDMFEVAIRFKDLYKLLSGGKEFPQDP